MVWPTKGYPAHRLVKLTVEPHARKVTYWNALGDGDYDTRWVWTPEQVRKEKPDGTVIESRNSPREAFASHNFLTKWDDFHLLYFMGYAIWDYLCTPFFFTWPGFKVREIENPLKDLPGARWRALEVTFPDDVDTHCKVQPFYFDDRHVLRRLDYKAEVVSGSSPGGAAHMCYDHREFGGLLIPTVRRVVQIPHGMMNGGPSAVTIDIYDVAVKY